MYHVQKGQYLEEFLSFFHRSCFNPIRVSARHSSNQQAIQSPPRPCTLASDSDAPTLPHITLSPMTLTSSSEIVSHSSNTSGTSLDLMQSPPAIGLVPSLPSASNSVLTTGISSSLLCTSASEMEKKFVFGTGSQTMAPNTSVVFKTSSSSNGILGPPSQRRSPSLLEHRLRAKAFWNNAGIREPLHGAGLNLTGDDFSSVRQSVQREFWLGYGYLEDFLKDAEKFRLVSMARVWG
ncbi:unnamed protein product [Protopolystoma xenopodis]|uniref:Uncharacterized protein n=1 Tax=Protopolystoma xenopodis TaxID=117903 RepID=A0A448WBE1_9PLAT|nr:unnamed protein product [Protopolystoma xenopodis]